MTMRAFGPAGSSKIGTACDLDFITISAGFSRTTSMEGVLGASFLIATGGGDLLIALLVMSASGVF